MFQLDRSKHELVYYGSKEAVVDNRMGTHWVDQKGSIDTNTMTRVCKSTARPVHARLWKWLSAPRNYHMA